MYDGNHCSFQSMTTTLISNTRSLSTKAPLVINKYLLLFLQYNIKYRKLHAIAAATVQPIVHT